MKQTKETVQDLRKIEKAIAKVRKSLKRADLDYTVQVSIVSTDPGVVRYAAQLTPPALGLAPVSFLSETAEDLVNQINAFRENTNYDDVEVAYHEAQILSCERTIVGHKERIDAILNKEEDGEEQGTETTEDAEDKSEE